MNVIAQVLRACLPRTPQRKSRWRGLRRVLPWLSRMVESSFTSLELLA
jgi:hypothetical protein